MLFADRPFGPAARTVKLHDDLQSGGFFHTQRKNAVLVGVELQILASGAPAAAFHRIEHNVGGELFLFLGRHLPLQVVWTWTERIKVTALETELEMIAPVASTRDERGSALRAFFRRQARLHLSERVAAFAPAMDVFPKELSIR